MMELNYHMLIPKWQPANREHRRLFTNEYARIIPHLYATDGDFLLDILTKDVPYREIYAKHLELYTKQLEWVKQVQKPKYFDLNMRYFEQMYKPLEDEV